MSNRWYVTVCLLLSALSEARSQQIATTDPLPAEKQRGRFTLPPGFEIQLVASEPDIGQPMNLNFDARGRLWVTHSVEYPFPAKGEGVQKRSNRFPGVGDHPPRDRLTVIDGIGPDGRPKRITHFATGLNIPIGQTPLGDGNEALVYSIPAIYRASDINGDGKADTRKKIFGGFGNTDTHGMVNSFTRWIDGWIYGCHGFANRSKTRDAQGNITTLRSGNTYRFRADGSRLEQMTWGQVNPFGLTFDPAGNLYSADCHSKPLYLLLRGAKYPHFGDKPDGLGFGPTIMSHQHGSTGICGPAYYAADHFPPAFRDNLFVCNPVSGRVNRDTLKRFGSTVQCQLQDDFVKCGDPWFRPVDAIVGPDGALYLADFYNAVIGHYEAPLKHPKRDRTHGRIWRIVYRGKGGKPLANPVDLANHTPEQLVKELAHPNLQVRTLATNLLVDIHAKTAPALVRRAVESSSEATVRAHGLWILERCGGLDEERLIALATDTSPLVRVHLMKMLAERTIWPADHFLKARKALADEDGFVRRAAADALARHPHQDNVLPLITAWSRAPAQDTHLIHAIRLALRQHVRDEKIVAALLTTPMDGPSRSRLVLIAAAADSEIAAPIFLFFAKPGTVSPATIQQAALQIARRGTPQQLARLTARVPTWLGDEAQQLEVLLAIYDGLRQKGAPPLQQREVKVELAKLVPRAIRTLADSPSQWSNRSVEGAKSSKSPWGIRHRRSTDRHATAQFWDSLAGGEQATGILRSVSFRLPKMLDFWMCGHNGRPGTNAPPLNHVRLIDAASGKVLAKQAPPRHDTARKYTWAIKKYAGQKVRIEIVDAHRGGSYAWIAVGRFNPPVLRVRTPQNSDQGRRLVEAVGQMRLKEFGPEVLRIMHDHRHRDATRAAALGSLESLVTRDRFVTETTALLSRVEDPAALRSQAAMALGAIPLDSAREALVQVLITASVDVQRGIALALSQSAKGRTALAEIVQSGKASARLLQDPQVAELLDAKGDDALKRRVTQLTKDLLPHNESIAKVISQRLASFDRRKASPQRGRELFTKHCAACHRVGNQGGMVGPQLDGIGARGSQRLLEDLLDTNRNVDKAFRTTVIITTDGKTLSGLERRREGKIVVLADALGKEFRVPLSKIEATRKTNLSVMPANFRDTLTPQQLHDLLAWLLTQTPAKNK